MGLDLTLRFPFIRAENIEEVAFSRNVDALDLDRHTDLFQEIKRLCKPKRLLANFGLPNEKDAYGNPLTYVLAEDLKKVGDSYRSKWNRAIWSLIESLPDQTPIILEWH